jgi:hypothetical protein
VPHHPGPHGVPVSPGPRTGYPLARVAQPGRAGRGGIGTAGTGRCRQPEPVRAAFHYCLALMMVEAGKARLIETLPGLATPTRRQAGDPRVESVVNCQ